MPPSEGRRWYQKGPFWSTRGIPLLVVLVGIAFVPCRAFAATLFAGIHATAPEHQGLATALNCDLAGSLSDLGPFVELDYVPPFETPKRWISGSEYLIGCDVASMDTCELICGIRAGSEHVLGGTIEGGETGPILEIRYSDVLTGAVIRARLDASADAAHVAVALREAMTRRSDPTPSASVAPPVSPERDVTTEDTAGIEKAASNTTATLSVLGIAQFCAEHGLTIQQYEAWRDSGSPIRTFQRMSRGRRDRLELSASVAGLAGAVAPTYAASVSLGEEGIYDGASVSYGLEQGLAGELSGTLAYGFSRTVQIRLGGGVAFGQGYSWLDSTSSTTAFHFHQEAVVDSVLRPMAIGGVCWFGFPTSTFHPVVGIDAVVMHVPDAGAATGAFPEATLTALGPRIRMGAAHEGRGGVEERIFVAIGTWQGSQMVREGAPEGPAGWEGSLPLYGTAGFELASARMTLRRSRQPSVEEEDSR